MPSHLLAWNPNRWQWDIAEHVASFNSGETSTGRWSCGRVKKIRRSDEIWFIRLGKEPRGIFGHGIAITPSYEDQHWDDSERTAQYVEYQIGSIVNPETDQIIPRTRLDDHPFQPMHWSPQMSGTSIPDDVAIALRQEWLRLMSGDDFMFPEEVPASPRYFEGAQRLVTINSYERNSRARSACIAHYGDRCVVCQFKFAEKYGPAGEGIIHVHHLTPLSETDESYELNPIEDLRPVCPNCHAIIHSRVPQYSIDDVKQMIGM